MQSTKHVVRAVTLIAATLTLTGCVTTTDGAGTKPRPIDARATCAAWEPMRWSRNDTDDTIRQAKAHNATGRALGCW